MAEKIVLSKKDRMKVCGRHQFLQGSWNYERMQNGGWSVSYTHLAGEWNHGYCGRLCDQYTTP